jgi:acetyl-CoA hydrolase
VQHRHALAQGGRLQVFVGLGLSDTLQPAHADVLDFLGYAASGPHRALAQAGVLDIIPSHYSQLPPLIAQGHIPADVVLLQVSPPDAQGRHSLGQVREYLPAAMERARVIVGEVHRDVPWTAGGPYLQAGDFDLLIDSDADLLDMARTEPGTVEHCAHIAGLAEDGSCLQLGVGNLPEAVLTALHRHKDLGLHSGAIGDGVVALAEPAC